ncbi:hypothetical protein [Arsenicicoccus dermatophilus]|uniref:hypothetical protein n=1 Tax=Arsenicicoccus dermatophilus TaxID=1076331 RepID=UPI001F4C5801|nr:hypothetical protein [Arsenicicoccus dermatophilus]MCH8612018.1 hypothetical protein [Arsenicicoccus dermatophilus]
MAHRPYVPSSSSDHGANVGPLRGYFHALGRDRRNRDWDLESVATFCDIIGLPAGVRPSEEALRAEGFEPRSCVRASVAAERPSRTQPLPVQPIEPVQPAPGPRQPVAPPPPTAAAPTRPAAAVPPTPPASSQPASSATVPITLPPAPPAPSSAPVPPAPSSAPVPPAPSSAAAPRRGAVLGRTGRGCLLAVIALVLLAVVAPSVAAIWRGVSTLSSTSSQTPTSSPSAGAAPPAALTMPSGNITCWGTGSGVRCTITEHDYRAPAAPAACRAAKRWGSTVEMIHNRPAALTCPPATPAPRGVVLPYGQSRVLGTATCTSTTSYVECKDGPHGLRLARASYRVW